MGGGGWWSDVSILRRILCPISRLDGSTSVRCLDHIPPEGLECQDNVASTPSSERKPSRLGCVGAWPARHNVQRNRCGRCGSPGAGLWAPSVKTAATAPLGDYLSRAPQPSSSPPIDLQHGHKEHLRHGRDRRRCGREGAVELGDARHLPRERGRAAAQGPAGAAARTRHRQGARPGRGEAHHAQDRLAPHPHADCHVLHLADRPDQPRCRALGQQQPV